jgi:membrane protease subunit HflK
MNDNSDRVGPMNSGISIEDRVRQWTARLKQRIPSGRQVFMLLFVIALVGAGAWTAYYAVPSDSVAVVQRFGRYLKEVSPGLHFKIPFGIDEVTIVPVKRQLKQEFGFATPGATDPFQSSHPRDGKRETQMVTGDLNAALVEWVVQYRVSPLCAAC